jgi:hypothetical protein
MSQCKSIPVFPGVEGFASQGGRRCDHHAKQRVGKLIDKGYLYKLFKNPVFIGVAA